MEVYMSEFIAISTDRLLIRNMNSKDAESFFAYKSLPECTQFQYWRPKTLGEIQQFIIDMEGTRLNTPGTWLQLAVCLKVDGRMIGDIGLHFLAEEDAQVELGYTISPEFQHKGYATETVRAIVSYLFSELGKHRITASVDPLNAPSAAVLKLVGFRQEAHFKKSVFMDGQWQDDCVYAILEDEFNGKL
jgi:RimJ/RimL family protein N-acetyltransferase